MSSRFIVLRDLEVIYPQQERPALTVDELEIDKGSTVLILGRSGCGKSTLGKVISGVIPHVERGIVRGVIEVAGKDPRIESIGKLIHTVAYLAQSPHDQTIFTRVLDEIRSVLENVRGEFEEQEVDHYLKILKIEHLKYRKVTELSGGEVQKVVIACVLAVDPQIVVLDEPLAHIDPKSCREFSNILKILREREKTVILIEHRFKELIRFIENKLIDLIVILDNGKIRHIIRPEEVFNRLKILKELGIAIPVNLELSIILNCRLRNCLDYRSVVLALELLKEKIRSVEREYEDFHNDVIISLRNLYAGYVKKFKGTKREVEWIIRNVNMDFKSGFIYGILGPNGTGKSTLLKAIIRQVPHVKGSIAIRGRKIRRIEDVFGIVGFVPQNPDLVLMYETVHRELMSRALIKYRNIKEAEKKVLEVCRDLNITELLDRCPHSLSRGQRFRVAVASVLVYEPDILLLDEPTVGQDEECIEILGDILRSYVKDGKVAIIVTHDLNFLMDYTDIAILLYDGEIISVDSPLRILSNVELVSRADIVSNEYVDVVSKFGIYVRPRELVKLIRENVQ